MKKLLAVLLTAVLTFGLLTGCGGKYKDGEYKGQSAPDDRGAYGDIKITVKGGKITVAEYKGVQKDGSVKDENYGKTNGKIENQDNYNKAQVAVKANGTYASELVKKQDATKVDTVSGATASYNQFKEAAAKALEMAKK